MQVRHSQRSSETPLSSWIVYECTGEVVCAHCNCMAGQGEVCTHVAAILFYLETAAKMNGTPTCTQQKCSWVIPAYQKDIPYAPVSQIDFSSAKSKMQKITAPPNQQGNQPSTSLQSAS